MVSILIPFYNAESTIKKCIDSILKQTYKEIYIVLLNDGSTDNSKQIVDEYDDVRIIYNENDGNKGRGYSRNRLLELSNTELCCWCDADDYMLPSKIEKQVKYFNENEDCKFLATEMYDMRNQQIIGLGCNKKTMVESLTLESLKVSNCINHPTVMFKLDIARNIKFKDNMKANEDWDFYIRLYELGYKVECVNEALYVYNL